MYVIYSYHKFFTLQIISGEDFDPIVDDCDVPVLTPATMLGISEVTISWESAVQCSNFLCS